MSLAPSGAAAPARLPPFPFIYPILDADLLAGRDAGSMAASVIDAGARLVQVRGKGLGDRDLLQMVRAVLAAARPRAARVIVNDRPDVARLAGADGVHVGQDDLDPAEARRVVGMEALVGVSTHDAAQLMAANAAPVDYIAIGPVFATLTKRGPDPLVGLDGVREARRISRHPVVAIGGIRVANAADVARAGAHGLSVASAVLSTADPAAAVRELQAALDASW